MVKYPFTLLPALIVTICGIAEHLKVYRIYIKGLFILKR